MTTREPRRTDGFMARSGSAELILRILQCCDSTRDLLALVSTCRRVCGVWRGNVAAAQWPVWLRQIPHFQDAVMAARMTQLVIDAERRGELPPTRISPRQLQQQRQQPTLSELRAALDLTYPSDRPAGRLGYGVPAEDPARMPEWTARVSLAVFRLLIVGAGLAGAYKESLLKALEHPDPEIKALPRRVPRDYSQDNGRNSLGQKELAFLLRFAVCDLDATLEAHDAVFGPIADWLLDSILSDKESRQAMADRFEQGCYYGRAGFCFSQAEEGHCPVDLLADGRGSHSDDHLVVWELMKMLWLVEQVRPYGLDHGVLDRRAPRPPSAQPDVGADENNRGPLESAVAVFFGMFRAEETLLLTTPTGGPWRRLITHPAVPETKEEDHRDGKLPRSMSVAVFFDYIFNHSGRPNHIEETGEPVAPLELECFEYFLQRHLGLCLDSQAFREDELEYMERSFQEFVGTITIFSHDDVENRCSFDYGDGRLNQANFLDDSEMLTEYLPNFTRFYQQRRW
ncbi:hypothetical protein C8A03DRAFT_38868 [Achaetomium macrosporum]|uniref:Uncharacterized protein n=1 Tax=Achaetomium macrosporum TaxID=79813 RepID=A0AAN7C159_9PEZI|nr:hypothetical protein C8A03DRAFT_38868 [Achaetomium macrosporum]